MTKNTVIKTFIDVSRVLMDDTHVCDEYLTRNKSTAPLYDAAQELDCYNWQNWRKPVRSATRVFFSNLDLVFKLIRKTMYHNDLQKHGIGFKQV